jgi:parallel beta-helix repeat protein
MLPATVFACPVNVSGTFVLTTDLTCNQNNGLVVAADHTTIYLNGHTISCIGPGLNGSCQKIVDPMNPSGPGLPPVSYSGVLNNGHSDVRVFGPGTIDGFGIGVRLSGGLDMKVQGVTVTGPVQTNAATNQRLTATGIIIADTACPVPADNVALVDGNEVMNQRFGVFLTSAECVKISDNHIHDNNSQFGDAHGIDIVDSRNNVVMKNIIESNGANRLQVAGVSDSGIQLVNGVPSGDTSGNHIQNNFVSNNCGDGIAAMIGAHDNTVLKNSARFNGDSTFGGQCLGPPLGTFFDLAERNAGPGNVWNPNNQCRTSSATIPAGVCSPVE